MKMSMLTAAAVIIGASFAGAATVKVEPAHARAWDQAAYDNCMDTLCVPQYEIGKTDASLTTLEATGCSACGMSTTRMKVA